MTHSPAEPDADARAWVDVSLDAVVANAQRVAQVSGTRLLPMVKANAYGLGAVPVTRALERIDPWGYGVATIEEGTELRSAGIGRPVVVFTPFLPRWAGAMIGHDLTPVLCDPAALTAWLAAAPSRPFHIGIDTGMARAGFACDDGAVLSAARSLLEGAAAYAGVCTHFHSADTDAVATDAQWDRFEEAVRALGARPPLVHAANSAAALAGRRYAADLVRPGIFLYGGSAGREVPQPAAALRARVVALRELAPGSGVSYGATWKAKARVAVATVAIGYADGVLRSLGNGGAFELGGQAAPIRGRVTMDMTVVGAPGGVAVGDTATVFGGLISLDDQAAAAGTISYELLTAMSSRVHRRYGPAS
ncbi:MAG: alanine racemase [Gemmatimonadales bacterium]|nr:alanine racemase [Gemmatimonadales bacterium]